MNTNHTTKPITLNGVKTNYTISTNGTVTSPSGRILKHSLCGNYYKVSICHDKQTHSLYVHRLLALHFLEVPEGNNIVVDHINDNKLDNSISNLQWVSQSENLKKATKSGTYKRVPDNIRKELLSKYHTDKMTGQELATAYNLNLQTVYSICNRKNK